MPLPEALGQILGALEQSGIEYMVTGSIASIVYGEPRLTNDVDLVVRFARGDAERLAKALGGRGFYIPPLEAICVEAARDRHGRLNLLHLDSAFKADLYFAGDDPLHGWAFPLRRRQQLDGLGFWLAAPEYVILRKLQFYRQRPSTKHLRDIAWMLKVSEAQIDQSLIERKVAELGLAAEWESARRTPLEL
jgi:hypothetical protein